MHRNCKMYRCFSCFNSVSTVLNRDVKQHGKTFLFDDLEDTAWYSDQVRFYSSTIRSTIHRYFILRTNVALQGLPQHINITFSQPIAAINLSTARLRIKFQGGFVGSEMRFNISDASGQSVYTNTFYPNDVNDLQTFLLSTEGSSSVENVKKIQIIFDKSSDFFGRVIIYHLEMFAE